jgi:response regulator RpfG family c-di-GMP phosphodiesterase
MAEGLQLPANERQILEISAWLHDVGLVGIPRRLIRMWQDAPKSLSPAELALVKQHPVMGQELAGFVHNLAEVGTIIRSHHERFDGTGYPDRRPGEHIPWLGRLLAVAVSYAEHCGGGRDALAIIAAAAVPLIRRPCESSHGTVRSHSIASSGRSGCRNCAQA